MKHHYYTHSYFGNKVVYRFEANNPHSGMWIDENHSTWCGGVTPRETQSNWTRISRDKARQLFPKGFRSVKSK